MGLLADAERERAEIVFDFDATVIVPRIVVGLATLGAVRRHVAVPETSCPADRFVDAPTFVAQLTVPVAIGALVSTRVG